jgi:hypothetical protein
MAESKKFAESFASKIEYSIDFGAGRSFADRNFVRKLVFHCLQKVAGKPERSQKVKTQSKVEFADGHVCHFILSNLFHIFAAF